MLLFFLFQNEAIEAETLGLSDLAISGYNFNRLRPRISNPKDNITIFIERHRMSDGAADKLNSDHIFFAFSAHFQNQVMAALFFGIATESGVIFNVLQTSVNASVNDAYSALKFPDTLTEYICPTVLGFYSET